MRYVEVMLILEDQDTASEIIESEVSDLLNEFGLDHSYVRDIGSVVKELVFDEPNRG